MTIETHERGRTENINSKKSVLTRGKNEDTGENKHAVTLSIYTQTTVKTVKLSVQKSTCY